MPNCPSKLKNWLNEKKAPLKKSLSQNFLIDNNIVDKILQISSPTQEETLLEIGPGAAILTHALLRTKAKVIAIEKDQRFASELSKLDLEKKNFHFISGDFLKVCDDLFKDIKTCKVIANIPYKITSLILEKLCANHQKILSATLMVQKEVAIRICAKKGKACGALSYFIQFYFEPKIAHNVSKNCFFPKPKVDSYILHLLPKIPLDIDSTAFFRLIRKSFQNRRKKLSNNLKAFYTKEEIEKAFQAMNLSENTRAEELTLENFLCLFSFLKK